jgi:hypothetical protein
LWKFGCKFDANNHGDYVSQYAYFLFWIYLKFDTAKIKIYWNKKQCIFRNIISVIIGVKFQSDFPNFEIKFQFEIEYIVVNPILWDYYQFQCKNKLKLITKFFFDIIFCVKFNIYSN